MDKIAIITIILVIVGFVIFSTGIALGELIWNIIGVALIILPPLILKLKEFKTKKKSVLYYIENEDESVLPTKKSQIKKREFKLSAIMGLFIALMAFGFASILLRNYVFTPSYLTFESAINDGCAELNMGGCKKDPSEITVNFDVNRDGINGGIGDNLSNLLGAYNCTGVCIRRRCGCPGY